MSEILETIYAAKAAELELEAAREPYRDLRERGLARRSERRSFAGALARARGHAIVAEIKRASPSAGLIARNFDVGARARAYTEAGADAISVLTERDHFLGDLAYLEAARAATPLPLLRKDFLWSRYHVAQSAAYGADAMLLIAAGADDATLRDALAEARDYDLDVLVEIHDAAELARIRTLEATLIGVNNRDLKSLVTDLAVGEHLIPQIPDGPLIVSESGVHGPDEAVRMRDAGADAFLIGEALMRVPDPRAQLQALRRALAARAASRT